MKNYRLLERPRAEDMPKPRQFILRVLIEEPSDSQAFLAAEAVCTDLERYAAACIVGARMAAKGLRVMVVRR